MPVDQRRRALEERAYREAQRFMRWLCGPDYEAPPFAPSPLTEESALTVEYTDGTRETIDLAVDLDAAERGVAECETELTRLAGEEEEQDAG